MFNPNNFIDIKKVNKSNYIDSITRLVPKVYFDVEQDQNNFQIDILDQIINSHLKIIGNINSIIYISSLNSGIYSSISTPGGIAPFFIKQNNNTNISYQDFDKLILNPLGKSLGDFKTSSDFSNYLATELLPNIRLNNPKINFLASGTPYQNHEYLIATLSWMYFLNSSSTTLAYNPSSFVHNTFIERIYNRSNDNISLTDGMQGLTEYIWRNYQNIQSLKNLIPIDYLPVISVKQDLYTSGDQQLEKLKTLVDIVYSDLRIDNSNLRLPLAIDDYLSNSYFITKKISVGIFHKLLKAISFSFADYSNFVDNIGILYDIEQCPDEYLPRLAELIGWELLGTDTARWRLQLINAADIYKVIGTKKCLQFASDSVFSQETFNVSARVTELWESYIPHLIYYALATESIYLKNMETWVSTFQSIRSYFNSLDPSSIVQTNNQYKQLGPGIELMMVSPNPSSMDENIRICTDQIILNIAKEFNSSFLINGKSFPLDDPKFTFNYRGRNFPIPPFEEYRYYTGTRIGNDQIDAISDWLACFGVPLDFCNKVSDYIRNNTITTQDNLRAGNNWLMFTSGADYAPNLNILVDDISNKRSEYLPLWNGKSSHFKLTYEATEFNFIKNTMEVDSGEALSIAAKIIRNFSPAHSIPLISTTLLGSDNYAGASGTDSNSLWVDNNDSLQINSSSGVSTSRFAISAVAMGSYKRGIGNTLPTFQRGDVNSIFDPLLNSSSVTANLPRLSHRRRDLKFILPLEGYYSRTGFNMPVSYNNSTKKFIALGLVPSSQTFVGIPDYNNIPPIYSICETSSSQNIFSGLEISNTYPIRGNKLSMLDRGQLHPFISVLHYIQEQFKLFDATVYYKKIPKVYNKESKWLNLISSYANIITESSGAFPNSFDDYTNFKFGRDFHKLYNEYITNFSNHRLSKQNLYLDGPTIFAHAFGSIIENSDLKSNGSLTKKFPSLISTSLDNIISFKANNSPFKINNETSGTFLVNYSNRDFREKHEFVNSGILNHVEFCQTSGSSDLNEFSVFRFYPNIKNLDRVDRFIYENTIIKQKSVDGFGRIIFNIGKYNMDIPNNTGYAANYNFLTPNHDFTFNFKSSFISLTGQSVPERIIKVWVHTQKELGKIWSYRDGSWIQHDADISKNDIINKYSFTLRFNGLPAKELKNRCIGTIVPALGLIKSENVINSFTEENFQFKEIKFSTNNKSCLDVGKSIIVPSDYYSQVAQQVHRLDQKYAIEVITLPDNLSDSETLYTNFSLIDNTLNTWSKPLWGSYENVLPLYDFCNEYRVSLTREQLYTIIKYFREISGNKKSNRFAYASRDGSYTSGVYSASGGSRINYVESPNWNNVGINTQYNILSSINLLN
jgi:hypothetical protein